MSSAKDIQGALNVERRTWNKEEYEARAKERIENGEQEEGDEALGPVRDREEFRHASAGAAGPLGSERAFLRARGGDLGLDEMVGRTTIVAPNAAANKQGGWFCDVCQCMLRDSVSYVDHINGRKHQRKLGFSMRSERATLGSVKDRLAAHRARKAADDALRAKRRRQSAAEAEREQIRDYEARLEEEAAEKRAAREARKRQKLEEKREREAAAAAEAEEEEEGMDPAMMAMMGFGGFGGSKKK
eukprot:CAMPEP_0118854322 /NCGR_PEP_ID=MMETSP1163-20130328/2571_1 /TAXON_ID=124430 /ORGANISM="Phaeomonas parva, Strain CCMP2877" /LENGTH=243 /DNA_ID=CAMNT_0006787031 /DNA_START=370 /DNA_END=1101 /DNA_ORIENTATION=+